MRSFIACLLLLPSYFFLLHSPVHAYDLTNIATTSSTATVKAVAPTTGDTTAPSNPILVRPLDGDASGNNKPEFVWQSSSDDNSNTITYTLYLNGVATYLGVSNLGNSAGSNYSARIDGSEVKLIPSISLPDGSYNWYVSAYDLANNTSYSTTWNLTIDTTAPHLTITDIDVYHDLTLDSNYPENFQNLNFDIAGPKDVYFTIHSEAWSTVTLQFYDTDNLLIGQSSWPVDGSGVVYPYQHLPLGIYRVTITGFDRGSNATALPDITLTISQAQISVTLPSMPGTSPTPIISIPYTPYSLPSLPATISIIQTRLTLPLIIIVLLAVLAILLLILFWKRKINLILLTPKGQPIRNAIIYHSIPSGAYTPGVKGAHTPGVLPSPIFITKKQPNLHTLLPSDQGRLYIPHLTRYSTFTVRVDKATYIFSLSLKRDLYTIVLG